jgi:hypothetical protein
VVQCAIFETKEIVMAKAKPHVVPRKNNEPGKKWGVKIEGNKRASALYPTQEKAIDAAKKIAKKEKTSVVIHSKKGPIRDTDSYGDESKKKDTKH